MDIALTQQAEVEELKDKVFAQQVFLEMQQDEIAALKAAHEQQMSSPVTPVDPYETPKASKGKRSPRARSGT